MSQTLDPSANMTCGLTTSSTNCDSSFPQWSRILVQLFPGHSEHAWHYLFLTLLWIFPTCMCLGPLVLTQLWSGEKKMLFLPFSASMDLNILCSIYMRLDGFWSYCPCQNPHIKNLNSDNIIDKITVRLHPSWRMLWIYQSDSCKRWERLFILYHRNKYAVISAPACHTISLC